MTKNLEKLVRNYWRISKIVGVVFTLWSYTMWTEPFNIIKALGIIIGIAVLTFLAINVLDITVGLIIALCRKIHRQFYDKKVLKKFCETNENESVEK